MIWGEISRINGYISSHIEPSFLSSALLLRLFNSLEKFVTYYLSENQLPTRILIEKQKEFISSYERIFWKENIT